MCKINFLVSTIFDPNNFYSRFSFLESDIQAVGKKIKEHFSEEKMLRRRIFSTSPYLSLLMPKPENGQTRHMLKHNNKTLLGMRNYYLLIISIRYGEKKTKNEKIIVGQKERIKNKVSIECTT